MDRGFLERRGVPSLLVVKRESRRCNVGRKDTPMLRVHQEELAREEFVLDLDEIARQGARRMLAQALEAEVQALTSKLPKENATTTGTPWSFAMATLKSER